MTESTLSVTYTELTRAVAHFAGWDRTEANWTSDQASDFADILKSGLRLFYYPPPLEPGEPRYEWSFLRKTGTLTFADADYTYDLPDDFAVLLDDSMTYAAASGYRRMIKVPEWHLRALQAKAGTTTGTPQYFCVRPTTFTSTTGLRYEAVVFPTPTAAATVTYRYVMCPNTIASGEYVYGGAIHSELVTEAVLAAAEAKLDDDPQGVHYQRYMTLLGASIRSDREVKQRTKEPSDS